MLDGDNEEICSRKLYKTVMLHQIKAQPFYTDLGHYQQC